MKIKYLILAVLLTLIAGCFDKNSSNTTNSKPVEKLNREVISAIEIVKNTKADNSNYTYGQVYNSRDFCTEIKWDGKQLNTGKITITNSCFVKLSESTKSNLKSIVRKGVNDESYSPYNYNEAIAKMEEELKAAQKRYNSGNNSEAGLLEAIELVESRLEEYRPLVKAELEKAKIKNEEIANSNFNPDQADMELKTTFDVVNNRVELAGFLLNVVGAKKSESIANTTNITLFAMELVNPESNPFRNNYRQWFNQYTHLAKKLSYAELTCNSNKFICE